MNRVRKALLLGVVVGTLGLCLCLTNIGLRLEEDIGLRWLFTARGPVPPPSNVAIVSVDRNSAQQAGLDTGEWPPRRNIYARVIRQLAAHEVSVVGVDILFATQRDPADDDDLADAIARSGNVVLIQNVDRLRLPGDVQVEQLSSPIETLQKSAIGLAPFPLPEGPLIHSFWPFFPTASGEVATLPAVVLQVHALPVLDRLVALLDRTGNIDTHEIRPEVASAADLRRLMDTLRQELGHNREGVTRAHTLLDGTEGGDPPTTRHALSALLELYAGSARRYLNFYGPAGTIETIPFHKLLSGEGNGVSVSGKVVFVGEGAATVRSANEPDTYRTVYSTSEGVDLSGVEISATAFANLLTGDVLRTVGPVGQTALLIGFGVAVGIPARLMPGAHGLLIAVVLGALYARGALFVFAQHSLVAPVAIPLLVQLPLATFVGLLARYRDIRKQVPAELDPSARQQVFQGVCLATDIRGYTALTTRLTPGELGQLLDKYYDTIRRVIRARHGMVWGRGGDSTLCLWKAQPHPQLWRRVQEWVGKGESVDTRLRLEACLAAVELRQAIDRFNAQHPESHQLSTRIGLDTGEVGLGFVGGELQAVGNPANTASRIQELNKLLSTKLLASTAVVLGLENLLVRPAGSFAIPGVSAKVTVVEILGVKDAASERERRLCEQFKTGLELYEERRWREAVACFREILRAHPGDGPSAYYLDQCERGLAPAPPPDA